MGFPPIPERAPQSAQNCTFAQKVYKKCGFAHFEALFLESAETPLSAQINYLAILALWLVLKFTRPGRHDYKIVPRNNYFCNILATRPKYPPYRETSVAIPLSHCVFFPVVSQTIAATPPLLSVKMAYRNPKTGLKRGYRRKSLPLKPIAL